MYKIATLCAAALVLAGCATAEREAFDPESDPRIGAEVKRACFSQTAAASGGYVRIGGKDAFVTGTMRRKYLLVFSPGCGDLGPGASVPVFYNYGADCRRRGERVEAFSSGFGVTGACVIQNIYEWNPGAEEEKPEDEN
jgi:hypothetical protein